MDFLSCNQLESYFKSNSDSDYVVIMSQTEFDLHPESFYEKDKDTGETIPLVFIDGDNYEVIIEGDDYDLR